MWKGNKHKKLITKYLPEKLSSEKSALVPNTICDSATKNAKKEYSQEKIPRKVLSQIIYS